MHLNKGIFYFYHAKNWETVHQALWHNGFQLLKKKETATGDTMSFLEE